MLAVPARPPQGRAVLLAPGAGAGQDHQFLAGTRDRLAAAGHLVLTFDYPYREAGRRAPDRPDVLMACHRAALERLRRYEARVVLAGKSMGGRVGGHLAASGEAPDGLVFLGYPLVAPGSGSIRPIEHLGAAGAPMLFLSGSRDRLAPLDLLRAAVQSLPSATLAVMEDGDHSFEVPRRTGLSQGDVLDRLAAITTEWIDSL